MDPKYYWILLGICGLLVYCSVGSIIGYFIYRSMQGDLTGNWDTYVSSDNTKKIWSFSIAQTDATKATVKEIAGTQVGRTAEAIIDGKTIKISAWGTSGTIADDYNKITFNDNSYWKRQTAST